MFEAVLFDLDGTFADTAPDLGGALNILLAEDGLPALPLEMLRPHTSSGTRGMLRIGYGVTPDAARFPELSARFLTHYANALCVGSRLFPGIETLICALEAAGTPWGIVTNKPRRFTEPLVNALPLGSRAACVVSGDTTPNPKPAPDSLLFACHALNVSPARTLYVGDDLRDITAGKAAGMPTAAANWGYLGVDHPIETWGADWIVDTPEALLHVRLQDSC
ncbi:MAG TPA: phosphoglycolate phosphatase [Denitromonas sp.]|uniref:phosphoglycolate phosphatase n=1 Tax=Denitromonas sp. TaxID=2734609 RepID=UPI001D4299D8|nr:phosphoglycolate phosphatase [Rhodocyclaceae bacterium]MCP5220064.1 phosphoglycolate phosphatase [Zoogloeaceae bacterium]HPR07090.1 phosphoglycolate phosphatase [Denitromonas sp.]HQU86977.1 phosphoglycolate phosphatase [Denitromonas sp.]HQV13272.1 phosphoglycolate phosphatase [Denitromonas sp.]